MVGYLLFFLKTLTPFTWLLTLFVYCSLGLAFAPIGLTKELKALQVIANFFSGDFLERRAQPADDDDAHLTIAPFRITNFTFIEFITHADRRMCLLNEETYRLQKMYEKSNGRRTRMPIRVQCLPQNDTSNVTLTVIDSLKEVAQLLGPLSNITKRTEPGNCALILFYTKSCVSSSLAAPHMNALPKYFQDIRMAAIDSYQFHSINTDFGVLALPTLMLFHRGRPVVKFNETAFTLNNFVKFIERHTGMKTSSSKVFVTSADFRGPLSNKLEKDTDYCLWLSWAFIAFCCVYHFFRSAYFAQVVEIIQRNWRESSEATQQ